MSETEARMSKNAVEFETKTSLKGKTNLDYYNNDFSSDLYTHKEKTASN